MDHVKRSVMALFLAIMLLAAGAPAAPDSFGKISGLALGPGNEGIPGITVTVAREGAAALFTVTGYGGVFSFPQLDPGEYQISAALEGIMESGKVPVVVQPGKTARATVSMSTLKLHEAITVQGRGETLAATEVRESASVDLGEAMMRMPGLAKVRKGAIANDIVLRGLQRDNINVLIDGERIYGACPNRMDSPAFHVDFSEIEHIEVTKGPFDIENQGSLGGMVNIVTLDPGPGFHQTANLAGGSSSYINPSINLSYGGKTISGAAGFSYRSSDPYRDGAAGFYRSRQLHPGKVRLPGFRRGHRLGQTLPDPQGGREDRDRLYPPASRLRFLSRAADGFALGPRRPPGDRLDAGKAVRIRPGFPGPRLCHPGQTLDDRTS